jgi:hypothetical protein
MIVPSKVVLSCLAAAVLTGCRSPAETITAEATSAETTFSAAESRAGIPPRPDEATARRYVDELNAIDPDIVHNKPDTAINRGGDQCSSMHTYPKDREKLIALTEARFSAPNHPGGFGPGKAALILLVVRKYLCPGEPS